MPFCVLKGDQVNGKKAKSARAYVQRQKNKVIADFITGENRDIVFLYCIDELKKLKLSKRLKVALSIMRGRKC